VSGLEYCLELQSVSLGENLIFSLSMKTLEKLRCLHKLRDFNLIGNPISKRIDEKTLCQYLPNLVYLDNAKLAQEYQNDDVILDSRRTHKGNHKMTLMIERMREILSNQEEFGKGNVQAKLTQIFEALNKYKDSTDRSLRVIDVQLNDMNNLLDKAMLQSLETIENVLDTTRADVASEDMMGIEFNAVKSLNGIIISTETNATIEKRRMVEDCKEIKEQIRKLLVESDAETDNEVKIKTLHEEIINAVESTLKNTEDHINSEIDSCREKILRKHRRRIQEINGIV